MNTREALSGMFKEKTPTSILDSGGAYGRHFEKNQGRNFTKEPDGQVEVENDGEVGLSMSSYAYLNGHTEYAEKLDHDFNAFAHLRDNEEDAWEKVIERWIKKIGAKLVGSGNTYNNDTLLSQDYQTHTFEKDDIFYTLLQIHGGCDIRGGYTAPKVFELGDEDAYHSFLRDASEASAYCNKDSNHSWDTEDAGYHWYFGGSTANAGEFDWKNINKKNGRAYCPCGGKIFFVVRSSEGGGDAPYYDHKTKTFEKYTKFHKPEENPPPGRYPPVKAVPYGTKVKGRKSAQFYLPGIKKGGN